MTAPPRVTAIVPVHDGGEAFRKCLTDLTQTVPPPDEIIVVDDGSTDGSAKVAEEFDAHVIKRSRPGGPARARNTGVASATGEIIFFIDADVAIRPDAIGLVQSALDHQSEISAVFGSYDDAPPQPNFLSQYKNLFHHYVHQTTSEEASTFWAGCGAIRRSVFQAVGGFDEAFVRPSVEDIELGYRLRKAGHRVRICKNLQGKHLKRWGIVSMLKADFLDRALPWTSLILHNRQFINELNVSPANRLCVALIFALVVALMLTLLWPGAWMAAGTITILLLIISSPLYLFFVRKKGLLFTLAVIPWHWLYYFYSGLAFTIGSLRHLANRRKMHS